ncbi:universal stress protein [Thiohalomonas denitrificans]|uniref:universal stress protein n=1 Tax=Thiohalomonas denitrificans TaxID=415747 RepID=UPI0026F34CE6|nr:universal stress protein [Thiohalomonas denitrificans]
MAGYRHIVFATDLTEAADTAAERVADQARCSGGRVTLLHVVEYLPGEVAGLMEERDDPESYIRKKAEKRLADWAERVHLSDAERHVTLTSYSARRGIIEYLDEQQADVVVLGALGNPGRLGTTVDHVAASAPCDVLIVQGKGWTPG